MPRKLKAVVAASALIGALLAAPALYAHGTGGSGMMGDMMQGRQGGMMDQGGMTQGMMGRMMNMMGQMTGMMEDCSEMMQRMEGAQRPNEQWQDREPEQPQSEGDAGR